MDNIIEYRVYGKRAMFADPITRVGGEKCTYPIPTYEALKGITESIYWKPTFQWIIDRVHIINPIKTESLGIRPIKYGGGNDLSLYTYLSDVSYEVMAHFEWDDSRSDLSNDRNENKHFFSARRMIERGGRRDIFLGTRECQGYIVPCKFGSNEGAYDRTPEYPFGLMYHGIDYPTADSEDLTVRFWKPIMKNGIIDFTHPENCETKRFVRKANYHKVDTTGADDDIMELKELA